MTIKQLREWLFTNGQEDQWWLCVDSVTEESPLTTSEIDSYLKQGEYASAQVLHVSQAEMSNPPWIDVDIQKLAPPTPTAGVSGTFRHVPVYNRPTTERPQEIIGIIILLLPLVSALLIWFWIGSMNMLQNPGSTLTMLVVGTVVITGILIGVEASQLGIGGENDRNSNGGRKTGPAGWAVFSLFLWIIGYPSYLWYRSRYGAKNMIVGGIAVVCIFLAASAYIGAAIDQQKSEIEYRLQDIENQRKQIERQYQDMFK